jgi:hypothetical protein
MPISFADAERVLLACGYSQFHETSKVKGFARGSSTMYLKKPKGGGKAIARPLVVHADDVLDFDKLMSIRGVERSKGRSDYYHNANMKAFCRRLNGGVQPTRYGYDFDFSDTAAMVSLLNEFR